MSGQAGQKAKGRRRERGGREGVRELFLDLIIREDLKEGPATIPEDQAVGK